MLSGLATLVSGIAIALLVGLMDDVEQAGRDTARMQAQIETLQANMQNNRDLYHLSRETERQSNAIERLFDRLRELEAERVGQKKAPRR